MTRFLLRFGTAASFVWRPVTSDPGDSWFAAWRKYRISPATAWKLAKIFNPLPTP